MKVDIFNTNKKYSIIYADPPWQYKVWSKDTGLKRSAESHYNTMQKEEIQGLPIRELTDKNAVLFLWVTYPCLQEGIELITKWGFTYKTCAFSWVKLNKKSNTPFTGMGYYTRANNEICLLATKGKVLPRKSKTVKQIVMTKIEEHSKKPSIVRDRITNLFGDLPRLELFARQHADGWDCWGNEV
ncbi:MAG: adenine methyltransferase [Clostridia bacterium]|nr:adenine methyltransferase [Clostridia bacterium]